jgi:intracellular multiplication protein IcmE
MSTEKLKKSKSSKFRSLAVFLAVVVLFVGLGLMLWSINRKNMEGPHGTVRLQTAPNIMSQPGASEASEEFARLQRQQNLEAARRAEALGTSAVPTITSKGHVGEDIIPEEDTSEQRKVAPNPEDCTPEKLQLAREAGVRASELECKGCTIGEIRQAGYTLGEMAESGFTARELRAAGYTAEALRNAGFSAGALSIAGFSLNTLRDVGYTAAQLKEAGVGAGDLIQAGYDIGALDLAGVSAQDLKKAGVSVEALKTGGYTAAELKNADFNALDLSSAGYSVPELVTAGYSNQALAQANISAVDIAKARELAGDLGKPPKNCDPDTLTKARLEGGLAGAIKEALNCPPENMKKAGYPAVALKDAGYTPADLKLANFTSGDLVAAGLMPEELKSAGFSALELRQAGVTLGELAQVGFLPHDLFGAGFSVSDIKDFSSLPPEAFKKDGVPVGQLKQAGYTNGELIRAGYATEDVVDVAPKTTPEETPPATSPDTADITARISDLSATLEDKPLSEPAVTTLPTPETNIEETQPSAVPVLPDQARESQAMIETLEKRHATQLAGQQTDEQVAQIQSGMMAQASDLISSWSPPPAQQVVIGSSNTENDRQAGAGGAALTSASSSQSASASGGSGTPSAPPEEIIKAGDIIFAVLDTAVNSDEESPILATVVGGNLKGAKLLGKFTRVEKKVLLSFSTMSVPDIPRSISINTVAIDPDTARTALASDVDSHYLLRYGTLFASSFLSGLGQAISQSGSTVVTEPFGSSIITNPTTSTTQQAVIALGNVGTQYANVLGRNFNTPPTVKVDAGQGLGILFMSDLALPARNKKQ